MESEIDTSTEALEQVFQHLECCDCSEEANIFRHLARERDELLSRLTQQGANTPATQ